MDIKIEITPPSNEDDFARIRLRIPGGGPSCNLHFGLSEFRGLGVNSTPKILDLLLLASIIYALDRRVPRERAADNWTRRFSLTLPVYDPDVWKAVRIPLEKCLSFLTGDRWDIDFTTRKLHLVHRMLGIDTRSSLNPGGVSLFSGGVDSLVGVIDWLEDNPDASLILVGHHDPRIPGPLADQKRVHSVIQRHYANRTHPVFVTVGADIGYDTTLRSRSFLFITLGLLATQAASNEAPLLVPENGTIALNVPLTPSRRGTCSTRTAHPHFFSLLREFLENLGVYNPIINPLESKTKGEAIVECRNQSVLNNAVPETASCAKRGHTSTWLRRSARECGRCIPCIFRRAALHRVGLDDQVYGRDICTGEVNLYSKYVYADDFRACVSFLHRNPTKEEVARLLLANGKLDVSRLSDYADIIIRSMDEVRNLLRDKAIDDIKMQAGL